MIYDELNVLYRQWSATTSMLTCITNSTKAYARSAAGFSTLHAETTRAEVVKKAQAWVKNPTAAPPHVQDFIAVQAECSRPHIAARKNIEAAMVERAKQCPQPVVDHIAEHKGLGLLSLAKIIGCTGDLNNYPNHRHVWKRLGLAPYNGKAASTWMRHKGLTAEQWTEIGYSPKRRAEVFVIGDVLIKSNGKDGLYRSYYDRVKPDEVRKANEAGLEVVPAARLKDKESQISEGQIHKRAQRKMEKLLIKNIWQLWNLGLTTDNNMI